MAIQPRHNICQENIHSLLTGHLLRLNSILLHCIFACFAFQLQLPERSFGHDGNTSPKYERSAKVTSCKHLSQSWFRKQTSSKIQLHLEEPVKRSGHVQLGNVENNWTQMTLYSTTSKPPPSYQLGPR